MATYELKRKHTADSKESVLEFCQTLPEAKTKMAVYLSGLNGCMVQLSDRNRRADVWQMCVGKKSYLMSFYIEHAAEVPAPVTA